MSIHPTAVIDPSAELGEGVGVGPHAIIERDVIVGDGCQIAANAVIHSYTTIGEGCQIGVGAVLGGIPQDRKFRGEISYLRIGARNVIREYVTFHRASGEGNETRIGDDNYIMACVHGGHNVRIGNECMIATFTGISGHVTIEDNANIGGMVGIHQFVTVGRLAMVAAMSGAARDVPPFTICEGRPARPRIINVVGLRRAGIPSESTDGLRSALRIMYFTGLNIGDAIGRVEEQVALTPEVEEFLEWHRARDEGARGRRMQP